MARSEGLAADQRAINALTASEAMCGGLYRVGRALAKGKCGLFECRMQLLEILLVQNTGTQIAR